MTIKPFICFYTTTLILILTNANIFAQNVGIGTTTPITGLQVNSNNGFMAKGKFGAGDVLTETGEGAKLIWYPKKAALRAGFVNSGLFSVVWDDDNIGTYSVALGLGVLAKGSGSTALGAGTRALAFYSTAMGDGTTAGGFASTAMGYSATAKGYVATAMGLGSTASGDYATATGNTTTASGINTTCMGDHSTAGGTNSTAIGTNSIANGNYSFAIGNSAVASADHAIALGAGVTANGNFSVALGTDVSTNNFSGSVIIGDGGDGDGTHVFGNEAANQMLARFKGGYKFYTMGWDATALGVEIVAGGNAWTSVCDKNLKENFEPLNCEDVLKKLAAVNYTSWNYKMQDAKAFRHYGIMAQDFFNAFGKDNYGTIGNDTTVNPIDMMGIAYSAIQALEKRTQKIEDLQKENDSLKKQLVELSIAIAGMQKQFTAFAKK